MNLLVTTDLKETFGTKEKIIFAGDWIKSNVNFQEKLNNRKYIFYNNNHSKIIKNNKYLHGLKQRLFLDLVPQLNKIHNLKYSLKFWGILLDPWLTMYLEANYFRWALVNKILKKKSIKFIYLNSIKNAGTIFDSWEFKALIGQSDVYNQYIFQKILLFLKNKKKYKINLVSSNKLIIENNKSLLIRKKSLINFLRGFISRLTYFFTKNNRFYFDLWFSGYKNFLLNYKLDQFPYKDEYFFSIDRYLKFFKKKIINTTLRKKIKFNQLKKNEFESFLSLNLGKDLPTSILENFSSIYEYVKKIPINPKIIVSDTNYVHNLIFKFWIAHRRINKTKFFISDHGGAFSHRTKLTNIKGWSLDRFDDENSDKVIRWHKPLTKKNVQLPALKIIKSKKFRHNYLEQKNLTMIGFETTKYPRYYLILPISGEALYQFNYFKTFYKNLKSSIKDNFLFKSYPKEIMNGGWNVDNRVKLIISKRKLIKNYNKAFKRSKIIVCNYPSTTFLEAMYSGPTILIYKKSYWMHTKEFNKLLFRLKKAKILFENPNHAAKHINKVWNHVDKWWKNKNVEKVRSQFFSEICDVRENAIDIWKDFLKKTKINSITFDSKSSIKSVRNNVGF